MRKQFFCIDRNFLVILVICFLFPLLITRYTALLSLAVVCVSCILAITRKELGYFLFIALLSCIPSQFGADADTSVFTTVNRYCEYFPLLLALLYIPKIKKSKFIRQELVFFLLLFILCTLWYVITMKEVEITVLFKYGLFFSVIIIFYKSSISRDDFYKMFDAVALVAGIYMTIEFFWRFAPYEEFINYGEGGIEQFDIASAFRPNGILCNPLTTSIVFLMELIFLFSRYLEKNKMNVSMTILTFLFCLMCVSRTAIAGALLIVLTSFYLKVKTSKNIPWKLYLSIGIGAAVVVSVFGVAIDFLLQRVSDGGGPDVGITFRLSNYVSVFNLVCDHPLGVGASNLIKVIETKYAGPGWISGFVTLDNFFLTSLGEYGLLFFVPVLFFFYWFVYARKKRTNIALYQQSVLIMITFFFASFSYDWESYNFILASLGGIVGVIVRDMENNTQQIEQISKSN